MPLDDRRNFRREKIMYDIFLGIMISPMGLALIAYFFSNDEVYLDP